MTPGHPAASDRRRTPPASAVAGPRFAFAGRGQNRRRRRRRRRRQNQPAPDPGACVQAATRRRKSDGAGRVRRRCLPAGGRRPPSAERAFCLPCALLGFCRKSAGAGRGPAAGVRRHGRLLAAAGPVLCSNVESTDGRHRCVRAGRAVARPPPSVLFVCLARADRAALGALSDSGAVDRASGFPISTEQKSIKLVCVVLSAWSRPHRFRDSDAASGCPATAGTCRQNAPLGCRKTPRACRPLCCAPSSLVAPTPPRLPAQAPARGRLRRRLPSPPLGSAAGTESNLNYSAHGATLPRVPARAPASGRRLLPRCRAGHATLDASKSPLLGGMEAQQGPS